MRIECFSHTEQPKTTKAGRCISNGNSYEGTHAMMPKGNENIVEDVFISSLIIIRHVAHVATWFFHCLKRC